MEFAARQYRAGSEQERTALMFTAVNVADNIAIRSISKNSRRCVLDSTYTRQNLMDSSDRVVEGEGLWVNHDLAMCGEVWSVVRRMRNHSSH